MILLQIIDYASVLLYRYMPVCMLMVYFYISPTNTVSTKFLHSEYFIHFLTCVLYSFYAYNKIPIYDKEYNEKEYNIIIFSSFYGITCCILQMVIISLIELNNSNSIGYLIKNIFMILISLHMVDSLLYSFDKHIWNQVFNSLIYFQHYEN